MPWPRYTGQGLRCIDADILVYTEALHLSS